MLLSFFELSLAIRNVWPRQMDLKMFMALYLMLLLAVRIVRYSGGGLYLWIGFLPGQRAPEHLHGRNRMRACFSDG